MRWHRDTWAEAVWASNLRPLARLVALTFADHARDAETAWVTYPRIMKRTGLSRDSVAKHLGAVIDAGWLVIVEPARQHRAPVYRLTIPAEQSACRTADADSAPTAPAQQSASADPAVRLSGPSRPPTGLNLSTNHKTQPQEKTRSLAAPAHPLPDDWAPNATHARTAVEAEVDLAETAEAFRAAMHGERRSNWCRTFGAYLGATADDREDVTFPASDDDVES